MQYERLGKAALAFFPAWAAIGLWTVALCEGAGFGAAAYRNDCTGFRLEQHCPLVHHALFPPQVSLGEFAANLCTLFVDGAYDIGLLFAIITGVGVLAVASRLTRYAAEAAFSWPVIAVCCGLFSVAGYFYEVHKTLSTGVAAVPLL